MPDLWEELNAQGQYYIPQSDVSWRVEGDVTHTIESRSRGIHIRPLGATASSVCAGPLPEKVASAGTAWSIGNRVYCIGKQGESLVLSFFSQTKRSMRLVGSQSQDMEERLSPSARLARSPGSQTRIHSIESILGFKGENIFHQAFSYGSGKSIKDTEHLSSPKKNSNNSKNFDGELTASQVTFVWV